ncbi:MAG: hypothetical protein AAF697_00595 [Pseudomonadota bacterium]
MLTDLFVANRDEAETLVSDFSRKPDLTTNNADNSVLAGLWRVLDSSADVSILEGDNCLAAMSTPEGPWVFDLPAAFLSALSRLQEDQLALTTSAWADTEEMQYSGARAEDLIEPLRALRSLASNAVAQEKQLLLRLAM